jgi:hypothetical protein
MNKDQFAEKYMIICNLIEAIWQKRKDDNYYDVDLNNLPNLTSPQARKIATFITDTLGVDEFVDDSNS